jgi:lipopolysaccharide export system protein LptC
MSVELHLPDLPEVPISLGTPRAAIARPAPTWHQRLRAVLATYLPLLVMGALALASWWLVKNSPRPVPAVEPKPVSGAPDYTMHDFTLERFDPGGRLSLRIEGARLRHFPVPDRIEVERATIRAIALDGRVTTAVAQQALANGDGSEVQLLGGAQVSSVDTAGQALDVRGEFLDLFLVTERVQSHLPVVVRFGGTVLHAAGLQYDNATRRLDLQGPMRAQMPPRWQR